MAAATVVSRSSLVSSHSSSPTRDLLVPELHLGSLQELQLTDFTAQHPQQSLYPMSPPSPSPSPYAANGASPPPAVALADSPQALPEPAYTPNGTPHTPVSAASSSQIKYNGLPPGAAPPAPGGGSGGSLYTPPTQQQQRRMSSEPLVASPTPLTPQDGGLPTPPPSHLQGSGSGPRHPGAAQAAAQSALPGAPRPRAAYAPAPTYPSIVTPMSLQGLIASESPAQQQQQQPQGTPPTTNQVAAVAAAVARRKPDEEVCIECMMRDRDMADVDVTSPGVWARPSDADFEDLLRREREEEMTDRGTSTGASSSSHSSRPKARSRGGRLTEENVRKWVLMNPKDHEARWRTITKYVKAQSVLLEQEFAARARNEAESRSQDARARDRYAQLRRSTVGEQGFLEPATGVRGVRVASTPTSSSQAQPTQSQGYFAAQPDAQQVPDAVETQSIPASPGRLLARAASSQQQTQQERDVVLLENGLMLERVDLRRERSGRARSVSLDKRSGQNMAGADDRLSVYSTPVPRYANPPVPSEGVPGGRTSRAIPRAQSQMSTDRRSLFSGLRSSLAGSMVSLTASRASVVNMHGQHFDRETLPGRAISPSMPTLNDLQHAEWPGIENLPAPPGVPASVGSEAGGKKKKRGALGKLLKFFGNSHSSSSSKSRPSSDSTAQPQHTPVPTPQEDLSAPLAPPPPLTYLMSRKSGELPGSSANAHQRQQSQTSLAGTGPSPPTAPSSILPSPTSNRFSWRASSASIDVMPNHQYVEFPAHLQQKHLDTLLEGNGNGSLFDEHATRRPSMRPRMDTSASSTVGRPHTVFLTDKSLPPLPPEAFAALHPPRPATAPGIRERERRQSFAGMPTTSQEAQHGRAATEFGDGGKRRSKFGFATLLGGKRKSSHQLRTASRDMSSVAQDEQFVAYRYLNPNDDPLAGAQQRR